MLHTRLLSRRKGQNIKSSLLLVYIKQLLPERGYYNVLIVSVPHLHASEGKKKVTPSLIESKY